MTANLPLTFREAVAVCQTLGVRVDFKLLSTTSISNIVLMLAYTLVRRNNDTSRYKRDEQFSIYLIFLL